MEKWERIDGGKYKLELEGWNFVIERINPIKNGSRYKFQLYENMRTPQSASALEIEINGSDLLDLKSIHEGAVKYIRDYFIEGKVFSYSGIPEPLKGNAEKALMRA